MRRLPARYGEGSVPPNWFHCGVRLDASRTFDFASFAPCARQFAMPRWLKFVIGILLLPVCFGAANALSRVLSAAGNAHTFWVALVGGAACWLAVFLLLPKPMLLYVFGHELTHAVWTWAFGGRVKRFKVTRGGGHVIITKSNFLIALAPYFFPLYVV